MITTGVAIEKEQGGRRDVLGRGSDTAVHGVVSEKLSNFCRIHLSRMTLPVEENEPLDPIAIRHLSPETEVSGASNIAHLVEQLSFRHGDA